MPVAGAVSMLWIALLPDAFANAAPVPLPPCEVSDAICHGDPTCTKVTYAHSEGGIDRTAVHDKALADGFAIACEGDGYFVVAKGGAMAPATPAREAARCATTSIPAGLSLLALALFLPRRRSTV